MAGSPAEPSGSARMPLMVDVSGWPVLVVGAGPVGLRRARSFAEFGAAVTLVTRDAPAGPVPEGVTLVERPVAEADLDGVRLVVLATDDPAVNGPLAAAAEARGALVNRADDAEGTPVAVPAVLRRDGLVLGVATEYRSPMLSAWVRHRLEERFEELVGTDPRKLADFFATLGVEMARNAESPEGAAVHSPFDWRSALDGSILDLIRDGHLAEAKERLQACLSSS